MGLSCPIGVSTRGSSRYDVNNPSIKAVIVERSPLDIITPTKWFPRSMGNLIHPGIIYLSFWLGRMRSLDRRLFLSLLERPSLLVVYCSVDLLSKFDAWLGGVFIHLMEGVVWPWHRHEGTPSITTMLPQWAFLFWDLHSPLDYLLTQPIVKEQPRDSIPRGQVRALLSVSGWLTLGRTKSRSFFRALYASSILICFSVLPRRSS